MDVQKVKVPYSELLLESFTHPMMYVLIFLGIIVSLLFTIINFNSSTKYKTLLSIVISTIILIVMILVFSFADSYEVMKGYNYEVNGQAKITKIENTDFAQHAHFVTNHKKYHIEIPKNQDVHKGDVIKIKTDDPYGVTILDNGRIQKDDLTKISFKYKN